MLSIIDKLDYSAGVVHILGKNCSGGGGGGGAGRGGR